ncbi:MAG: hypothetical protein Q4A90_09955 [Streptococcus sp.]|nr:hypothetical protein [Streptococcus sp.]
MVLNMTFAQKQANKVFSTLDTVQLRRKASKISTAHGLAQGVSGTSIELARLIATEGNTERIPTAYAASILGFYLNSSKRHYLTNKTLLESLLDGDVIYYESFI